MTKEGRLTINGGISRLDDTRLMRGALNNAGFGRATSFLRQERLLASGNRIFVDGVEREFDGDDVIVISNAGRAIAAAAAAAAGRKAGETTKKGRARTAKKSTTKRSATKRSTAKRSTRKKATKGSTKKPRSRSRS